MKKVVCFFLILGFAFLIPKKANANYNQYVNRSYIVMDVSNNNIIEGKNINLVRNVASVSKIMTAIVAIENGDLNKEVTIIKEDLNTYGSSIYLKEGNTIHLLELIYGLMLRSGNDASLAIARSVGESVENFVFLMNKKAKELGMKNSVFNNPSGLDTNEEGNKSTSYDLAILMSYAIKNEIFLKIINSKTYKSEVGLWKNKNKLLNTYKYNLGGKAGFTDKAKRTLVTASKKDDTTLVVVTLDCGNDFNFHKFLYEKNFENYKTFKVLGKGDNYIEEYIVRCNKDVYVTLEVEILDRYSFLYKIRKNDANIYLVNGYEEEEIGSCLVRVNEVKPKGFFNWFKNVFS